MTLEEYWTLMAEQREKLLKQRQVLQLRRSEAEDDKHEGILMASEVCQRLRTTVQGGKPVAFVSTVIERLAWRNARRDVVRRDAEALSIDDDAEQPDVCELLFAPEVQNVVGPLLLELPEK